MPRRPCCRRIRSRPGAAAFLPAGGAGEPAEPVHLALDEFEALRLADLLGLHQAAAAPLMGVSRPTFGRILEAAHRKLAAALVHGRGLRIEGGPVAEVLPLTRHCPRCAHAWQPAPAGPEPPRCPRCRRSSAGPPDRREEEIESPSSPSRSERARNEP
ncbi:MAG: DUF134 domain-containing protein [Planctomycetota bacterium]